MRLHFASAVAGFALLAAGSAAAQTVVIQPEQETVILDYITTQSVEPVVEIPADVDVTIGATLPDTIELHAVEVPDLETQDQYGVLDNRPVLVEPETRKIVHIIER